ncbi:DUF502 domain-containing protein [Elusimicrobiota bacterium]
MWKWIRKNFITGMAFLLPISVAVVIITVLFNIVSGFARPFLKYGFEYFLPKAPADFLIRLASLLVTVFLVCLVGFIVSRIFGRAFTIRIDSLFARIPLVSSIYDAVKKLTALFISEDSFGKNFKRVVLLEFPRDGIYSFGFVTSENFTSGNDATGKKLLVIFVPTTPNPTNGYLTFVPEDKVISINLPLEEAVRIIFSAGLVAS